MPHNPITISEGWKGLLKSYEQEHFPDERLKARLAGESEARQMLDEKAGNMSPEDIKQFLFALNTDWWNGKTMHVRFRPAFFGALYGLLGTINDDLRQLFFSQSSIFFDAHNRCKYGLKAFDTAAHAGIINPKQEPQEKLSCVAAIVKQEAQNVILQIFQTIWSSGYFLLRQELIP